MTDCHSTCTYSGAPAISTWTETEFCLFYTDTGASESSVRGFTSIPSCLDTIACPAAFCYTFAILAEQCGNSVYNNRTEIDSIWNECLSSYAASEPNQTSVVFNVELQLTSANESEFDNVVLQDAIVHALVHSMRRSEVLTGTYVGYTYTPPSRLRRLGDYGNVVLEDMNSGNTYNTMNTGVGKGREYGENRRVMDYRDAHRRLLVGTTVIEIQISTVLSSLGYADADILTAFADLKAQVEDAVSGVYGR